MSEEKVEKVSFIVGKCRKCGKDIDNMVEGYIRDSRGNIYCVNCYNRE